MHLKYIPFIKDWQLHIGRDNPELVKKCRTLDTFAWVLSLQPFAFHCLGDVQCEHNTFTYKQVK